MMFCGIKNPVDFYIHAGKGYLSLLIGRLRLHKIFLQYMGSFFVRLIRYSDRNHVIFNSAV